MMARQSKIDEPTDVGKQSTAAASGTSPDRDDGFVGELKRIQLDNLIQLYCLSAETIAVKIQNGAYTGTVFLEDGEIVHAESGPKSGEEAFYTIMALQGGRIETSQTERAEVRSINKNYQFLLMEAARLSDEESWIDEAMSDDVDIDSSECAFIGEEEKLKALIVDDSAFMRKIIAGMLTAEGDIEVVGMADNGKAALMSLAQYKPDFIILDANMPVMDGPTTLKHIMIKTPCPVIVMSNLAEGDQHTLTHFFNLGAVDFLPKPVKNKNMLVQQQQILSRARSAAKARILNFKRYSAAGTADAKNGPAENSDHSQLVVLISGSGGFHEMLHIIAMLPGAPNMYFTAFQSLPEEFSGNFSIAAGKHARLNTVPVDVRLRMAPGHCYIASQETRVLLQKEDGGYTLQPDATAYSRSGKARNIDDFLTLAIENFDGTVHVAFLSGTDEIAAASLDAIQEKGGRIIVQDPALCMMPHFLEELISKDYADIVASPENIVSEVLALSAGSGVS
jgi:two-component system chemotaxis response regulator CheB